MINYQLKAKCEAKGASLTVLRGFKSPTAKKRERSLISEFNCKSAEFQEDGLLHPSRPPTQRSGPSVQSMYLRQDEDI